MYSPELQAQVAIWRAKGDRNELTVEEMREAVKLLRGGRLLAANASEQSRRKAAKAAIPSADDFLAELGAE